MEGFRAARGRAGAIDVRECDATRTARVSDCRAAAEKFRWRRSMRLESGNGCAAGILSDRGRWHVDC
jgi:hypothetical protein